VSRIYRAVLSAAIIAVLAACGEDGDDPVVPPDGPGTFAVGHRTFTAVDAARDNRSLLVDLWYPVDAAGRFTGTLPKRSKPYTRTA